MKKIALLGATGQTGNQFLLKVLDKGYNVKALVRNPNKLEIQHPLLEVLKGDVQNPHDVEKLVSSTDVVVSLFGHVKGSADWVQTEGTKNIVAAMKKNNVRRIISLSGGALPFPEKDEPKFADKLIRGIMKIVASKILNDSIEHAKVLKTSGLEWTIVRGPRLTNEPGKGTYRVGWVGVNSSTQISRSDLADFIVTLINDTSYDGQMPFVSI